MDQNDRAEFDSAHDTLEQLRAESGGRIVLDHVEQAARSTAQLAWTAAKPILQAGGQAAIDALASFASSSLVEELKKLAGNAGSA